MKKLIVVIGIIVLAATFVSAGGRKLSLFKTAQATKQQCVGFTVIEAGKGINCYGDTIKLSKVNGYFTATIRE